MNLSLFKSRHGLMAALICVVSIVWIIAIDASVGTREGSNTSYVLWSGWIAAVLMAVATLYCVRKYMHKLRYSPEFKLKVPVASLEAADARLNDIRRRILRQDFSSMKEVEDAAQRVVIDEGVSKVIRIEVKDGDRDIGEPQYIIEVKPPDKYGRMTKWLHAHVYYGLASAVIVWLHGGGAMTHPMGILLNVLTLVVILTGVVGIVLFAYGPSWMTRNEKDLNFESNFVLDASLREKIKTHLETVNAKLSGEVSMLKALNLGLAAGSQEQLTATFNHWMVNKRSKLDAMDRVCATVTSDNGMDKAAVAEIRSEAVFAAAVDKAAAADEEDPKKTAAALKKVRDGYANECNLVRDAVILIGQKKGTSRGLAKLTRIKFFMNVWRAIHIPASIILLALVFLHALSVWWY